MHFHLSSSPSWVRMRVTTLLRVSNARICIRAEIVIPQESNIGDTEASDSAKRDACWGSRSSCLVCWASGKDAAGDGPRPAAKASASRRLSIQMRVRCLTIRSAACFTASRLDFFWASCRAAALIRARCRTANPPELVSQSLPRLALQNGHPREMGLIGRTSGMTVFFAITKSNSTRPGPRRLAGSLLFHDAAHRWGTRRTPYGRGPVLGDPSE